MASKELLKRKEQRVFSKTALCIHMVQSKQGTNQHNASVETTLQTVLELQPMIISTINEVF